MLLRLSGDAMEFKESVKMALQSLWANKLRSVLTLLGVVIGVSSVIAVVTLGERREYVCDDEVFELRLGRVHRVADAAG